MNGEGSRAPRAVDVFSHVANFGSVLHHQAMHQPDATAFRFLADDGTESETLTFFQLHVRALAISAHITAGGYRAEPVLLLYRPGLEFVAAFFGCLYAGCFATPAYPPTGRSSRRSRLQAIIGDSGARLILTESSAEAAVREELDGLDGDIRVLASDRWAPAGGEAALELPADVPSGSVALLQYTSGSTGTAKGVMVTHGNLLANERAMRLAFRHEADAVVVGWCPVYHDMGLIGNVLQAVYLGVPAVLMSPVSFLQKPIRWLRAISRYRATFSGGPNFAYQLCADKITDDEKAGLDLSCWRNAFNGAEPVRAQTLAKFADAFACAGFDRRALFPCYGMAEATLFVSGATAGAGAVVHAVDAGALQRNEWLPHDAAAPGAVELASSGLVGGDQEVRVVDPDSCIEVPPGGIGEIWVTGSSVAAGYWRREEETARQFHARIRGHEASGPWLRTGDLGTVAGGEVFITGRLKELIIIRGRNHYPQDIEQTVQESDLAFLRGGGAAFSVQAGDAECLVVAHEVQRTALRNLDAHTLAERAKRVVAKTHGIALHDLVVLRPGAIPKTSSGKTQRRLVKAMYESGELPRMTREFSR